MTKKQLLEKGNYYFFNGYSCAETSLQAGAEYFGVDNKCTPAVAAAFGGGIQGWGHICGAFSGTMMLIGILYGKQTPEDSKEEANHKNDAFIDYCLSRWGSLMCRDICQLDFKNEKLEPGEKQKAKEQTCAPLLLEVLKWQAENL